LVSPFLRAQTSDLRVERVTIPDKAVKAGGGAVAAFITRSTPLTAL
jgi:hypothetical protein